MKPQLILLLLFVTLASCVQIDPRAQIQKSVRPGDVVQNKDWTPVEQEFDGVPMVLVPAGCFLMGSDDGREMDAPIHEQCINNPFWIDKLEVTNAEFARFMEAGGYEDSSFWTKPGWEWRESQGITEPDDWELCTLNDPQQPVSALSWYEAYAYTKWRGVDLCSEVQWEYAARGPDSLIYPWGNEFVADNVVYTGNSRGRIAGVGSRPSGASWVGALDMSGNVAEWTRSISRPYPYLNDGREDLQWIATWITRGGTRYDNEKNVRADLRNSDHAQTLDNANGFRTCRPDEASATARPITLLEAWEIAQKHAQAWSDDAELFYLMSADVDDNDQSPRTDGTRRVWQAEFLSFNERKQFHIQIVDAAVTDAIENTGIPYDSRTPIIAEKPTIDSPEALSIVQNEFPNFGPSVGRGKGYHFGLYNDEAGQPFMNVVGSIKGEDGTTVPTSVTLDPATGEVLGSQELPR